MTSNRDYFYTTDYIINTQKKLYANVKKLYRGEDLRRYELKPVLTDVLSETNKIAMSLRCAIHEGYGARLTEEEKTLISAPVIAIKPSNAYIRLVVPPLQNKYYKGSYDIYYAAKIAVKNFLEKQQNFKKIEEPCVIIYKRFVPNPTNPLLCDNDSWEMGRVTNAIAEEMLMNRDSATSLSFVYTTVESDKNKVEATLIPLKNLNLFTEYISSN